MARKNGRRAPGSDVRLLWEMPSTEVSTAGLTTTKSSTGRDGMDMTELRDLVRRLEVAVRDGRNILRELRIEVRQARRVLEKSDEVKRERRVLEKSDEVKRERVS